MLGRSTQSYYDFKSFGNKSCLTVARYLDLHMKDKVS